MHKRLRIVLVLSKRKFTRIYLGDMGVRKVRLVEATPIQFLRPSVIGDIRTLAANISAGTIYT